MSKKIFFVLSLFTTILVGCDKPPMACMEINPTSIAVGTPVEFTSCSEHALSYEWFIDGPEDAPENSKGWSDELFFNTFTVPGTYDVKLSVFENFSFGGRVSTIEQTIVVN